MAYLIETTTNNPSFKKPQFSIRRRYSDFEFLFHCLLSDFPTSLVPPLPEKHSFQYLKGETTRLGESFTAKRCHSLDKFLARILNHPVLSQSRVLYVFLESADWVTYKKNLNIVASDESLSQSAVDTLTETLMNAFKRTEETNEDILLIHEKLNKLNDNLSKIEKIFGKVSQKHELLSLSYLSFHKNLTKMIGSGIEENLTLEFTIFNQGIKSYSENLASYAQYLEQNFIVDLKDLIALIINFKRLLKTKQDRKLDLELLIGYLSDYKYEKNKLITQSASSHSPMGAIRNKLEDLKGVNHEQARIARINKLEDKIKQLETEITTQEKLLAEFEKNLMKEWEYFEKVKVRELKGSLLALCQFNIDFYLGAIGDFKAIETKLYAKYQGINDLVEAETPLVKEP
ncbi:hypothetical protein BABINDRAFT_54328 [Babjeviella inositovora NRRL Y-12698]|uniref:Sorting nexin-4 n=1 Tax=Babjeviella inositovora NRRL Y-12698 TaxID=984486 RepID=A0A1E3QIB8_9ASCO|nr:uncharacterized protein BABINDRAFT_54328 [Babjeviella inositovora NRRL Y-12698]ODQ77441.1 hypothetical protein BABINDRAFT_54328 [Babjeviella inositovora NRRL Y-12698]